MPPSNKQKPKKKKQVKTKTSLKQRQAAQTPKNFMAEDIGDEKNPPNKPTPEPQAAQSPKNLMTEVIVKGKAPPNKSLPELQAAQSPQNLMTEDIDNGKTPSNKPLPEPQAAHSLKNFMIEGIGDGKMSLNKQPPEPQAAHSPKNLMTEDTGDVKEPSDKPLPEPQEAQTPKNLTAKGTNALNEPLNKPLPDSAEAVLQLNNQSTEEKMAMAMVFKLNARNTNYDDSNNVQWLLQAGFTEHEITTELRNRFKKSFSYKFRKLINPTTIPEEDQPWHKHWIKKLELTPDLLKFLPETEKLFPSSKEDTTHHLFERIGRTSIKQRKLQGGNGRLRDSKTVTQIYKTFNNFFKVSGVPRDLGVDLDYTIIHLLFTDDDTAINFQDPHTDYPYHITRRNLIDKVRLSWTAHLPITPDGSWITMWFGPGVGYTLHIPFGTALLLRSDVIHGGGVPHIDIQTTSKQFRRVHFYLATQDQAATPGLIYELNYDNETRLLDTCYQAKRSFNQN
jgi:hypothetical protein